MGGTDPKIPNLQVKKTNSEKKNWCIGPHLTTPRSATVNVDQLDVRGGGSSFC